MDKLKRLLRDVEPTSDYTNEVVYTHIVQNIIPNIKSNECPPLAVLVHIAQGIIKPTLLYEDIPSLLDIIGQIEHIRCLAVEQANAALALNTRYTFKPKPGVRLLDASEKKTLKKIAKEEKAENCRMVYREEIILSLYRLHIYRLWTSPQLYTLHKVMRSFFPSLSVKSGDPWADEYWQSLHNIHFTREERELVHGVGEATKAFLAEAYKWDQSRKEYLRDTLK
ncbi:hypothetical protein DFH11DRAFT_107800 [Phellopilus nigrolimitatus]|nr:hypothetical protein DFH11DRAFT_107800 [Phellopilus nigrolimitatus]